jgi:hypothetical protein
MHRSALKNDHNPKATCLYLWRTAIVPLHSHHVGWPSLVPVYPILWRFAEFEPQSYQRGLRESNQKLAEAVTGAAIMESKAGCFKTSTSVIKML